MMLKNLLWRMVCAVCVRYRNRKLCLDVLFGSCCLPGLTVDAHIKHEVDFLFLRKRQGCLTFLLFMLRTFSSQSHSYKDCNSFCKTIIGVKFVSCRRDLRFTSITAPTSSVLEMLEESRPSYLIHTSVRVHWLSLRNTFSFRRY